MNGKTRAITGKQNVICYERNVRLMQVIVACLLEVVFQSGVKKSDYQNCYLICTKMLRMQNNQMWIKLIKRFRILNAAFSDYEKEIVVRPFAIVSLWLAVLR